MAPFRSEKGTRGFPPSVHAWAARMAAALHTALAKRGFHLGSGYTMDNGKSVVWKAVIRRGPHSFSDTTGEIELQIGWKYKIVLRCWACARSPGYVEWEAVAPRSGRFAPRRTAARVAAAYARWAASLAVKDVMGA